MAEEMAEEEVTEHCRFPDTEVFNACLYGKVDTIKRLVPKELDVNTRFDDQNTPLHLVSVRGWTECVEALLELGADVNLQNQLTYTPLYLACLTHRLNIVQLLMARGADANIRDSDGVTALARACMNGQYPVAAQLLEQNGRSPDKSDNTSYIEVDVNAVDNRNLTPLHHACHRGHLELVKLLVSKNADIRAKHVKHVPPLMTACITQEALVIEYLLQCDPHLANDDRAYPLHHVTSEAYRDYRRVIELLLKSKIDVNRRDTRRATPLHYACQSGLHHIVKLLVQHGAQVNVKDYRGASVLHYAVSKPGNVDILKYLVQKGADINAANDVGSVALHSNMFKGDNDMRDYLLKLHRKQVG